LGAKLTDESLRESLTAKKRHYHCSHSARLLRGRTEHSWVLRPNSVAAPLRLRSLRGFAAVASNLMLSLETTEKPNGEPASPKSNKALKIKARKSELRAVKNFRPRAAQPLDRGRLRSNAATSKAAASKNACGPSPFQAGGGGLRCCANPRGTDHRRDHEDERLGQQHSIRGLLCRA